MKRNVMILIAFVLMLTVSAQEPQKFSPEKFEADLEAFITKEAGFTQQEAAKFFPLFKELHEKQRALYGRIRKAAMTKPADEKSAAEAIRQSDKLNLELKQLDQKYHDKMIKEVPASKVYLAINAENHFHRNMMKGWQRPYSPMGKRRDKRR